jgi:hypothetical protein
MRRFNPTTLLVAAALALPGVALADHNSRWGEGWANMPNDVHNTRIETRGDNEAFRDFVRYGNGAESENRFDTRDRGSARLDARSQSRTQSRSASTQGRGGRR